MNSIAPWVSKYLVDVAEEHGANTASIPWVTKKRKVQIIEFLTYGEDEVIWAKISDKDVSIHIRFNKEAVAEYNMLNTTRITKHKTAIISIKDFRPFFSRVPSGKGRMSDESFLAIECNAFSAIGSFGEARFGDPKSVREDKDLREWSDGLRKGGGAGNCLMNRKAHREQSTKSAEPVKPSLLPKAPATGSVEQKSKTVRTIQNSSGKSIRQHTWTIAKNALLQKPPPEIARLHARMKVDGDPNIESGKVEQVAVISTTPHKRHRLSIAPEPSPVIPNIRPRSRSATPISETEWPPSHIVQRPQPLRSSVGPVSTPPPARSPIVISNTTNPEHCLKSTTRPLHSEEPAPPSSSPSSQLSAVEETKLLKCPLPMHTRREVLRKVSPPRQPIPIPHSQGETVILVPNSDTSLSYSQSLSQQQSQSRSQSQPLNSSQPVILSQLASLSKGWEPPDLQKGPVDNHAKTLLSDYPSLDYDGDRSSPGVSPPGKRPFIRASHRQVSSREDRRGTKGAEDNDNIGEYPVGHPNNCVHRDVRSPNSRRGKDGSTELTNASPIINAQSPVSDGHDVGIPFDRKDTKENDARVSASQAFVDLTKKRIFSGARDKPLDDDDAAETHVILFGSSLRSNVSSQMQQPSPPLSDIIPFQVLKRNRETEASDRSSTSAPGDSLTGEGRHSLITEPEVGQGQYDPQEWKEPSFLRSRSNMIGAESRITPRGQLTRSKLDESVPPSRPTSVPQTFKPSPSVNEGGSSRKQGQLSNVSTTASQQRGILSSSSHGDHKTDSSKRGTPTSRTLVQRARHEDNLTTRQGPATEADMRLESRLRSTKRERTLIVDDSTTGSEPTRERAKKKRKVVDVPRLEEGHEDAGVDAFRNKQAQQRSKLNGFTVNLDRIKLDDLKYPVVTWDRINEIIQGLDEDRAREGSREMVS